MTDAEWSLVEPQIPPANRGGNKRHVNLREVVNGLMYILSTSCQWRALPKDLPPRSTVYDYFDLWSWDDGVSIKFRRKARADWLALIPLPDIKQRLARQMVRPDCRVVDTVLVDQETIYVPDRAMTGCSWA